MRMGLDLSVGRSVEKRHYEITLLTCSQAFLLYGPLSQASWPKKLADSRSAYTSLREHFLKYIDHPNDLQSAGDPLADDANVCRVP